MVFVGIIFVRIQQKNKLSRRRKKAMEKSNKLIERSVMCWWLSCQSGTRTWRTYVRTYYPSYISSKARHRHNVATETFVPRTHELPFDLQKKEKGVEAEKKGPSDLLYEENESSTVYKYRYVPASPHLWIPLRARANEEFIDDWCGNRYSQLSLQMKIVIDARSRTHRENASVIFIFRAFIYLFTLVICWLNLDFLLKSPWSGSSSRIYLSNNCRSHWNYSLWKHFFSNDWRVCVTHSVLKWKFHFTSIKIKHHRIIRW